MNNRDIIKSIDTKLSKLASFLDKLPIDHVPVNEIKNVTTLWNEELKQSSKGKWVAKDGYYLPPTVMGLDGKMVKADELVKQVLGNTGYANDARFAMDNGYGSGITQLNSTNQFNQLNSVLIDNYFLGYGELSLLSQNSLLRRICEVTAEEMCRQWIEFKSIDDGVDDTKLKELTAEFDRLGMKDLFYWSAFLTFVFGGCQQFVKLQGDDDQQDTELFIDESSINIGDVEYMGVIEPTWYVPISYNTVEPRSKWFYEPEYYTVLNVITHASRLFKMVYAKNVNLMRPVYLFNGIGLLSQEISWVLKFENAYNSIVTIINRFNLSVLKTNLSSMVDDSTINGVGSWAANFKNRIDIFNQFRNNLSTLALAENEEFEQVQMSLAGLEGLLTKCLEYITIPAGIPIIKLFGNSPAGMNATGDFEMKNWYDRVHSLQESMFRTNITKFMHIAMLNIWGKIDEDITFEFCKLEETNPLEDAQIRQADAATATTYLQGGVLSPNEIRSKLASSLDSGYNDIEELSEDIENEIDPDIPEEQPDEYNGVVMRNN